RGLAQFAVAVALPGSVEPFRILGELVAQVDTLARDLGVLFGQVTDLLLMLLHQHRLAAGVCDLLAGMGDVRPVARGRIAIDVAAVAGLGANLAGRGDRKSGAADACHQYLRGAGTDRGDGAGLVGVAPASGVPACARRAARASPPARAISRRSAG